MTRLLLATSNPGKVAELAPLLAPLGFELCGLQAFPDLPPLVEDAASFAGNARAKAAQAAAGSGLAALADDSGLVVPALGGAPGVRSARYAGEDATDADNLARLLAELTAVEDRRARFECALCLVRDGEPLLEVSGACAGSLLRTPRGSGGFGYDPLFVPDDDRAGGLTFAEMGAERKRTLSHRGQALRALRAALQHPAGGQGGPP